MAKFRDLDEYFDPGLTLPVRGKEYVLPLPSAELGLWCRRVAQAAGEVHAASTEDEMQAAIERVNNLPELPGGKDITLQERVLGDVYQQMLDDKLPDPYIQFCGATAYIWIIGGEDAAERYWTSGGRPEAQSPAPNRAERRARTGQTSTGGAPTTRTRASTSGTRSRKKSPGNGKGSGSRGRRSSPTGG